MNGSISTTTTNVYQRKMSKCSEFTECYFTDQSSDVTNTLSLRKRKLTFASKYLLF